MICSSRFNLDLWKILLTIFIYSSYFSKNSLIQHADIELNPGPSKKHRPLTCCHWNVNSLTAHKMLKKLLIETYNTNHNYDFVCINETYLDSAVAADDRDLVIEGYNLVHADHPSNCKKSGVCIYYKESSAVHLINVNYLSECLVCEVTVDNS